MKLTNGISIEERRPIMLEALKKEVWEANMELPKRGLVVYTWGNVSGIDRESGLVVIKPSGVAYEDLKVEDMVIVDLQGKVVEGSYKPSSDTPTHIELYKAFAEVGGIVHTHSSMAVSFAQAGRSVVAMGTTHADYFYGTIPCTRDLTKEEIEASYEAQTGRVIVETFKGIEPLHIPAVLVKEHGPFTWGKNAMEAVYHSVVLEEVCKMAWQTTLLNHTSVGMQHDLLDKHFLRKHGAQAYYGQN